MVKKLILERDGMINHRQEEDIATVEGRDSISGSIEAIKRLKKASYRATLASNHSDVERGHCSEGCLTKMPQKMRRFPETRGVPLYDDLAHFVRDTLRGR